MDLRAHPLHDGMERAQREAMRPSFLAVTLAAVGCASSPPPHPPWVPQPTSALIEIPFPPPPARAEYMPKSPVADAVWVDGEWRWKGRRWAWESGRWVVVPTGAAFSPWVTVRNGDRVLFLASGTWRDASGAEIPAPKSLAIGSASPGSVVASDGVTEETGPNIKDPTVEKKPEEKTLEMSAPDAGPAEKP